MRSLVFPNIRHGVGAGPRDLLVVLPSGTQCSAMFPMGWGLALETSCSPVFANMFPKAPHCVPWGGGES